MNNSRIPQLTFHHHPVSRIPVDFLSFTLDTSLVLGGHWWGEKRSMTRGVAVNKVAPFDLDQEKLHFFTKALAPAMLRIGGTEADRVRYHLHKGSPNPDTHEYSLLKKDWKRINRFARSNGLTLLFTLSAGPDDRDQMGAWIDFLARDLISYTVKKNFPVAAWELGNEVNGFPFIHGWSSRVSAAQYSADFQRLGLLLQDLNPKALAVGPSSAVWPIIGEPNPIISSLCKSKSAQFLGAVSWHYYPQQSSHGRIATRRVGKSTMLKPRNLDGVQRWTRSVRRSLKACPQPGVQNWMTETAHALYGGEPGISDTFASTLWWLDELGLLAREGVDKVFRQSLVGARYGLLDEKTLDPRPDYYACFLWKKLMGPLVYSSQVKEKKPSKLRIYIHGPDDGSAQRTLLVINLSEKRSFQLSFPSPIRRRFRLEGVHGLCSSTVKLNGIPVDVDLVQDWGKKRWDLKYGTSEFGTEADFPPLSCTFMEI